MAKLFRIMNGLRIYLLLLLAFAKGQPRICMFNHHYSADCRYPIDGVSMVRIKATVNYCNDPIDVSFTLESDKPALVWHHTFANDNEIQMVPGYGVSIQMQVILHIVEENKLWIKVDFLVQGRKRTYFMNEKIKLTNMESCLQLNQAGKIAIGCLVALLIIAGILLVVLVIIRRQRRLAEQHEDAIIQQMEVNEQANPVPDNLRETHDECIHDAEDSSVPVVRFSLPTIPEQSESSSDSGHVSIELTNGHVPSHLSLETQTGGHPI